MIARGILRPSAGARPRRFAARLALAALTSAGACVWSTADLVADANLQIDLARVSDVAQLARVTVDDAAGARFTREAARSGPTMTMYVGHLATGPAVVRTELVTAAGEVTTCREDQVQIGIRVRAHLDLDLGLVVTETDAACSDGIDNDCNGLVDCADPSCHLASRFCAVGGCLGEQRCLGPDWGTCTGLSLKPERSLDLCHDGIDNDCDGLVDCDDPDCRDFGC